MLRGSRIARASGSECRRLRRPRTGCRGRARRTRRARRRRGTTRDIAVPRGRPASNSDARSDASTRSTIGPEVGVACAGRPGRVRVQSTCDRAEEHPGLLRDRRARSHRRPGPRARFRRRPRCPSCRRELELPGEQLGVGARRGRASAQPAFVELGHLDEISYRSRTASVDAPRRRSRAHRRRARAGARCSRAGRGTAALNVGSSSAVTRSIARRCSSSARSRSGLDDVAQAMPSTRQRRRPRRTGRRRRGTAPPPPRAARRSTSVHRDAPARPTTRT